MLTSEQISVLSARFHIDPLSVVREYLQVLFLAQLAGTPEAIHWCFKGGTAIRLLKQSFRFSEDLDFTVTTTPRRVIQTMERILLAMRRQVPGLSLRKSSSAPSALTVHLRYAPADLKYPLVLRLQCSLRERPQQPRTSLLETPYPIPYPWVQHLDWPEILAEKIRALVIRDKGRDLFDLWFLLSKGVALDWRLIRSKMKLYRRTLTLKGLLAAVRRMDGQRLMRDLGPFLPREHRRLPLELAARLEDQLLATGRK